MLGWFKSSFRDLDVWPGRDGVPLLNSFYVSGTRIVTQMNKLVYAVEKLIRKIDRQNVTRQCGKCFYLFRNSTNINKCHGGVKVCPNPVRLLQRPGELHREGSSQARMWRRPSSKSSLHKVKRAGMAAVGAVCARHGGCGGLAEAREEILVGYRCAQPHR